MLLLLSTRSEIVNFLAGASRDYGDSFLLPSTASLSQAVNERGI